MHEECKGKESGKREREEEEAVRSETLFEGDSFETGRDRGKALKGRFSGVLVSRLSILRRKRRGAKIQEDDDSPESSSKDHACSFMHYF